MTTEIGIEIYCFLESDLKNLRPSVTDSNACFALATFFRPLLADFPALTPAPVIFQNRPYRTRRAARGQPQTTTSGTIKQTSQKSHRIFGKALFYNVNHGFGASQKSGL
jgi:hypothetical protein